MSVAVWKQWLVDFIHNRPEDDDWVEILIDFLGLWPVWMTIWILLIGVFIYTCVTLERESNRSSAD